MTKNRKSDIRILDAAGGKKKDPAQSSPWGIKVKTEQKVDGEFKPKTPGVGNFPEGSYVRKKLSKHETVNDSQERGESENQIPAGKKERWAGGGVTCKQSWGKVRRKSGPAGWEKTSGRKRKNHGVGLWHKREHHPEATNDIYQKIWDLTGNK